MPSISSLPPSVIQKVFRAIDKRCHIHPHLNCRLRSCITSFPLVLGAICKEWREIAWNMPELWGWIEITESRKSPDTLLQLAREWLERASGQPLTIIVHPTPCMAQYSHPLPTGIFKLIAEYSNQWKVLDIVTYGEATRELNVARGRVPILESVHIKSNGVDKDVLPLNFLEDCPNIRHLNLVGVSRIGQDMRPWLNLASLKITGFRTNTDLPLILNDSPNLDTLWVDASSPGPWVPGATAEWLPGLTSPLVLPRRLKSLILNGGETPLFLSNMEAPDSLLRLSVINHGDRAPAKSPIPHITEFLGRSNCTLRALGISIQVPIDINALSLLFSKLAPLEILYIDSRTTNNYSQMMNQIPQLLNPSLRVLANDSILLPNLRIIYYSMIDVGLVPQRLCDMIKCRFQGRNVDERGGKVGDGEYARLRTVRFHKKNPPVLLGPLRAEIEEGLNITYDLPYKGEPFE